MLPVAISANGTIQLATPGSEGIQGLQAVTMANSGGSQQGTTVLQYAQTPDGQQILVPSNQVVVQGEHYLTFSRNSFVCPCIKSVVLCVCVCVMRSGAGGELQTYQIRTATASSSLPQTVVTNSPVGLSQLKLDDPTVKREIRLAKNRQVSALSSRIFFFFNGIKHSFLKSSFH